MTTKERVVREAMTRVKSRLDEIVKMLDHDPVAGIIECREEAQKMLDENPGWEKRTAPEFVKKWKAIFKRDKKLRKDLTFLSGEKMSELNMERVKLDRELADLNSELYYIERGR